MTVDTCIKPAELIVLVVIHVQIDFPQQFSIDCNCDVLTTILRGSSRTIWRGKKSLRTKIFVTTS